MAEDKPQGQGNTEVTNEVFKRYRPKYDEVCIGIDNCMAIKSCDELPSILAKLGIDDGDLVEIVTKTVCGGD